MDSFEFVLGWNMNFFRQNHQAIQNQTLSQCEVVSEALEALEYYTSGPGAKENHATKRIQSCPPFGFNLKYSDANALIYTKLSFSQ